MDSWGVTFLNIWGVTFLDSWGVKVLDSLGVKFLGVQEWWDWDGLGPYKYRHHHYPNNITLRDVQRRRIFKKLHGERSRLGLIR